MSAEERKAQGDLPALERIVAVLEELRSPFALYEQDLHAAVARRMQEAGLSFVHEKKLGPGCRVDFWWEGVGVEVKKGKPAPAALLAQLRRYAAAEEIDALVVLTERSARLPDALCGKPLRQIALNRLWGVALP